MDPAPPRAEDGYFPQFLQPDDLLFVRFTGKSADNGRIVVQDYIAALTGLEQLLFLTERLIADRKPTSRLRLARRRPQLSVVAEREGSFGSVIEWTMLMWIAGSAAPHIPKANRAAAKYICNAIQKLVRFLLTARHDGRDAPAIARDINRYLAELTGIDDVVELAETVTLLDAALEQVTRPLDRSADTIHVTYGRSQTIAVLDEDDRLSVAIPVDPGDDEPVGDPIARYAYFVRLNNQTRRGILSFRDEDGRRRHCLINDPRFLSAPNLYDAAFADRVWLDTFVQEMKPHDSGRHGYWVVLDSSGQTTHDDPPAVSSDS